MSTNRANSTNSNTDPADLPNLFETEIGDVWRQRQEHKEAEVYHHAHRRHADAEVLRRAAEREAQIIDTEHGAITVTYPNAYEYDTGQVDNVLFPLIERDGLQAEWNQFVRHSYKIDRRFLNRLLKRGREYVDAVEAATIATKGSPNIDGPTLDQMGGYAPESEIEAEELRI